jgi:hypothetical protein
VLAVLQKLRVELATIDMEQRRGELRELGGEKGGVVCGVVNVLHHGGCLGVPALSYKPEFIFYYRAVVTVFVSVWHQNI